MTDRAFIPDHGPTPTPDRRHRMTEHDTTLLRRVGAHPRLILADHIARHLFGDMLDAETPVGMAVLATVGRELTLPMADAALTCPGFTYTGGES